MRPRTAAHHPHGLFPIEGEVWRPTTFTALTLSELHEDYQVPDVSKIDYRLSGRAVRLRKLIDLVGPDFGARYVTVESKDGTFSATFPIPEISKTGLIVFETKSGAPLPAEQGGPARLIVPFHPDKCANVKSIGRMVISRDPGRDTRPSTRGEHDKLHAG